MASTPKFPTHQIYPEFIPHHLVVAHEATRHWSFTLKTTPSTKAARSLKLIRRSGLRKLLARQLGTMHSDFQNWLDQSIALVLRGARPLGTKYFTSRRVRFEALETRALMATDLVSAVDPSKVAATANAVSRSPSLSADGRYIAFTSYATNLLANDSTVDTNVANFYSQIYTKDATTGLVSIESMPASGASPDGYSRDPSLSGDGQWLVFTSQASNLVANDTNAHPDIFLKNRTTGQLTLVSTTADGQLANEESLQPEISANGRYLTFTSYASNLVADDTNNARDVFVKDLVTGAIVRASVTEGGQQGNQSSQNPSISADGTRVAFTSAASNFAVGVTPVQVYVKNLNSGVLQLASSTSTSQPANIGSDQAKISASGNVVVFSTSATNLVSGDGDFDSDVFAKNLTTGELKLVSTGASGIGNSSSGSSLDVSFFGTTVVFSSFASNLTVGATGGFEHVYHKDLVTGQVRRIGSASQTNASEYNATISSDGQVVAFASFAGNLTPADFNQTEDVFTASLSNNQVSAVSTRVRPSWSAGGSSSSSINRDGRYIAFVSDSNNLTTDSSPLSQLPYEGVFIRDTVTGSTRIASSNSLGEKANSEASYPSISSDGRWVAFQSRASNLVSGTAPNTSNIFVKDTQTGELFLVSQSMSGVPGNADSSNPVISESGRYVVFTAFANNLTDDGVTSGGLLRKDMLTGALVRVDTTAAGAAGNLVGYSPSISADGRFVAFLSSASNLVAGDNNAARDVYVKDLFSGAIRMINTLNGVQANGFVNNPIISADGRRVAFLTNAAALTQDNSPSNYYLLIKNLATDELVNLGQTFVNSTFDFSDDGTKIAYQSLAGARREVFITDLPGGSTTQVSLGDNSSLDIDASVNISGDGRFVTYNSFSATTHYNARSSALNIYRYTAQNDLFISSTTLPVNQPAGALVGNLSVTGVDSTSTYALVSGTGATDNHRFSIVDNQLFAQFATTGSLQDSYSIRVRGTTVASSVEKVITIRPYQSPRVVDVQISGAAVTNGSGLINAGNQLTLTVNFNANVTVGDLNGLPTLRLSNGREARYSGGSGSSALTFRYDTAEGDDTQDLAVQALNLNGSTIKSGGLDVILTGATTNPAGTLAIDTVAPQVTLSLVGSETQSNTPVQFAVTFSEPVTGITQSNFSLSTTGGILGAAITGLTQVDATHYLVEATTQSGSGELILNFDQTTVGDLAGNGLGGGLLDTYWQSTSAQILSAIALNDVNGDGRLDMLVTGSSSQVSVRLGDDNGSFGEVTNYLAGGNPADMIVADFNGDGRQDIATANQNLDTLYSANMSTNPGWTLGANGFFGWQYGQPPGFNSDPNSGFSGPNVIGTGFGPYGSANIGSPVYATTPSFSAANFNHVELRFKRWLTVPTTATATVELNVNGAGWNTLWSNNSGQIVDTSWNDEAMIITNLVEGASSVQVRFGLVGDLAGLGGWNIDDFIVQGISSSIGVSILLGSGDGLFGSPANFSVGSTGSLSAITTGDFNRDGKLDLATSNFLSNSVSILLATTAGSFALAGTLTTDSRPVDIDTGDLNGDGKLDIIVGNDHDSSVNIYFGTTPGNFAERVNYASGVGFDSGPQSIVVADLDGDDALDIVAANRNSTLSIFHNNGVGLFEDVETVNFSRTRQVSIADFNGDGLADILATRGIGQGAFIRRQNPNGAFATLSSSALIAFDPVSAIGDVDLDGRPDFVLAGRDGAVAYIHNRPPFIANTRFTIADTTGPTVSNTSISNSTVTAGTSTLTVTFSEPMANATDPAHYELRRAGEDGLLLSSDTPIQPLSATWNGQSIVLTFDSALALQPDTYRLTILDTLTDLSGNGFDGDGDGLAGGNWQTDFVVSPSRMTRTSTTSNGSQANDRSDSPSLSSDGRYVAFSSLASNFIDDDNNATYDIYVKDNLTGLVKLASASSDNVIGNGQSYNPILSADGRFVSFWSYASNLVPNDNNGTYDAFVKDLLTGAITRVSVSSLGEEGNGGTEVTVLSSDGRYVLFYSGASNLVANDNNGALDVFLHDRQTNTTTLISSTAGGVQGNDSSYRQTISQDGRYAAFISFANNLVPIDNNGTFDIFVKDLQTGAIKLVSTSSNNQQSNLGADSPSLSADGRYVAFMSPASNLVGDDNNGAYDIFLKDTVTGQLTRVSTSSVGAEANANFVWPDCQPRWSLRDVRKLRQQPGRWRYQ